MRSVASFGMLRRARRRFDAGRSTSPDPRPAACWPDTFLIAVSETNDTKSFVLGMDAEPTAGLLGTTTMCSRQSWSPRATRIVRLAATFAPTCAIDVEAIE